MKKMVLVKKIDWLDTGNPEAEVLFEVDAKQFWAFCHPCDLNEGQITDIEVSFIEEEIQESMFWYGNDDKKMDIVPREDQRCSYYCFGKITAIHPVIVDCGVLTFSFGDWINDTQTIGNYVYFVISRLDIKKVI